MHKISKLFVTLQQNELDHMQTRQTISERSPAACWSQCFLPAIAALIWSSQCQNTLRPAIKTQKDQPQSLSTGSVSRPCLI